MDSRLYWIWLQQVLPYGCGTVGELLDSFGHARTIYEATPDALRQAGLAADLCRRLGDKSLDTARRILDRALELGEWMLTPEDALYPLSLRHMPDCPTVLYARGVMPDLDTTPSVAVVGTRRPSKEGWREAHALSAGLAAGGAVVVSGGAVGIDAAVHTGALDAGGTTIVVMACPLSVNYPADNATLRERVVANGGLLISEFPPDQPYKCEFPVRNRLMVGLSQAVCLAETPTRSGARITARLGREHNRDVYAMPGALSGHHYDGAHREIQNGATLVIRATDILRDLAPLFPGTLDLERAEERQKMLEQSAPPVAEKTTRRRRKSAVKKEKPAPPAEVAVTDAVACPDTATPTAKQVYAVLTDTLQPVDDLALGADLPIPAVLAALTELEMYGCAVNSAGQQYKRT